MADEGNYDRVLTRRKVSPVVDQEFYPDSNQKPQGENGIEVKRKAKKKESPYSFGNFMWIVAAITVLYYTNIALEAFTNIKVDRWWFNVGSLLFGINVTICAFLICYVSFYKKVDSDLWEEQYPIAIPVATAAFAMGSFCWNVAFWPVYSFLTPVFLFVLLMGVVVTIAMLPAF